MYIYDIYKCFGTSYLQCIEYRILNTFIIHVLFVSSILCHWSKNSKPASNPTCRCASPADCQAWSTKMWLINFIALTISFNFRTSSVDQMPTLHCSPSFSLCTITGSCFATGSIFICTLLQLTCIYNYLSIYVHLSIIFCTIMSV